MTKAEAVEKIVKECNNHNSCGDCPLYVRGNFTKCAIAVMIGVVPARWEDKQAHTVKKMAENKMEQVAALFCKKLGERFIADIVDGERVGYCWFTPTGLEGQWLKGDRADIFLVKLLTGQAEIVEEENNKNGRQDSKISSSGRV